MGNIRQNLFWAFGYKVILIPVAAGVLYPVWGVLLSPMLGAAAMGLSSLFVLAFMLNMYEDTRKNIAIFAGSALLFVLSFWLVRTQDTVGDVAWMTAMIPHHSIAILTSEQTNISDPRVRQLADEIIEAQRREIAEMERLIAELQQ